MIEIIVISEITACLRFARRYLIATSSSNFIKRISHKKAQEAQNVPFVSFVPFCG
jgi:hypothetical protein